MISSSERKVGCTGLLRQPLQCFAVLFVAGIQRPLELLASAFVRRGSDHEQPAVGRNVQRRLFVDAQQIQDGSVDHQGEAVTDANGIVTLGDDGETALARDENIRDFGDGASLARLGPVFASMGAQGYDDILTAHRRGLDAVRLRDGFPEWRDAGLPVEVGAAAGRRTKEQH